MIVLWSAAFAAFTLHNIEELWFDLPRWSMQQPSLMWMAAIMPPQRFVHSIIVLSCLVILLATVSAWLSRKVRIMLLRLFAWIMVLNALSHMVLSGLTRSLMPGVLTAVVVILPVMTWIIAELRHKQNRN